MGALAFLMDLFVMEMPILRWESTQFMARTSPFLGWLVLALYSTLFILISAMLTVYFAPAARGSGVAEAIGFLNGVAIPDYISLKTLVVKFLGLCFAVAGGVCGGKEGPLVHIGSLIGYSSAYIPLAFTKYFRNDLEKRKLMAIGMAAGVSAAFGAPIGGSLFAYELSKPNTFWSFSLTWKVFFASTISTFTLSVFKQLFDGILPIMISNDDIVKLGGRQGIDNNVTMDCIIGVIFLGIFGGLLGAFFIIVNNRINLLRKKFLVKKHSNIIEAVVIILLTTSTMYIAAYLVYALSDDPDNNEAVCTQIGTQDKTMFRKFLCGENEDDDRYDRLATLLFGT